MQQHVRKEPHFPVSRVKLDDLERVLSDAHRNPPATNPILPDPMTRDVTGIAKMAGAGVVGISETMIAEIRKSMAEVQAQCDAVLADGNALIKQLQDGSAKVEDTIRGFADLQAKVQLAFKQAGNDVATFGKQS